MADIDAKVWLESVMLDEDTMSSNSDTDVATQQSIKAYVDNTYSGLTTYIDSGDATTLASANAYTDSSVVAHPRDHASSLSAYHDIILNSSVGLEFQTTQYDVVNAPPSTNPSIPGTTPPDWAKLADDGGGSTGLYTLVFSPSTEEEIFRLVPFPERKKPGTNIYPVMYWTPVGTEAGTYVRWGIEYIYGDTSTMLIGNTTLIHASAHAPSGTLTNGYIYGTLFPAVSTPLNDMQGIFMRIFRDATHVDDTYTNDAGMISLSIFYHVDSLAENWALNSFYPYIPY